MTIATLKPAKRLRRAPDELRAEAMAAARRLILENSDQALTMKAVADAIGVTHPNLSHHFGSAAGLHAAVAEQMVSELLQGLRGIASEFEDGGKDPRVLVDQVFDAFDRGGLGRVVTWLVQSGDTAQLENVRKMISDYIAEAAAKHGEGADTHIGRIAMVVTLAAYAEAQAGPMIGGMLGFSGEERRALLARMIGPMMAHA